MNYRQEYRNSDQGVNVWTGSPWKASCCSHLTDNYKYHNFSIKLKTSSKSGWDESSNNENSQELKSDLGWEGHRVVGQNTFVRTKGIYLDAPSRKEDLNPRYLNHFAKLKSRGQRTQQDQVHLIRFWKLEAGKAPASG